MGKLWCLTNNIYEHVKKCLKHIKKIEWNKICDIIKKLISNGTLKHKWNIPSKLLCVQIPMHKYNIIDIKALIYCKNFNPLKYTFKNQTRNGHCQS